MKPTPVSGPPVTIGELVRRRLREMNRSVEDLAAAVEVPVHYVEDVVAGVRQPAPGRSDIYGRMTSFLRLGRNDLSNCVQSEGAVGVGRGAGPGAPVRRLLLELCERRTAERLEQRREENGGAELTSLCARLLFVAQGVVRRVLDDQAQLRLAAAECGRSYSAMRFHVLDFLDATPRTVTPEALKEFLTPRIERWDVELDTGVMRVVLRSTDRRRPVKGRALQGA